jgi:hypothetical protein
MNRMLRALAGMLVALGALFVAGTGTAMAAAPGAYTCAGGTIPAGTYSSLRVTGVCALSAGDTVRVQGNVTLAPGAVLDAATQPATMQVGGNVRVEKGAILGLGCSPETGCPGNTFDRIGGNIIATQAAASIVHNTTIGGNVVLSGGGGSEDCGANSPIGGPYFSDLEDNTIGGNTIVTGLQTCWFGFIRNHASGNVILHHNSYGDPDADEIVTNTISGNLICSGNSPAPQVGDSGGAPNVVLGHKLGQCASIQ